jgi:hypothetical protein
MIKYILAILLTVSFSACTVKLKDDRIDPESLNSKLAMLDKVDQLIVDKLKELQDKGYLDNPEKKEEK